MSYTTIHQCANDPEFQARLMACAAQEGEPNPEYSMSVLLRWPVSSATDIEAAYAYAVETDNPNPGGDPLVITDGMILAKVQDVLHPPPDIGNELPDPEEEA